MPMEEGAAISFALNGDQRPFRVGLDVTSACYLSSTTPSQVEIGTIVMAEVPWAQSSSTDPILRWSTIGVVPSANAIVTMNHSLLTAGYNTPTSNDVRCWQ